MKILSLVGARPQFIKEAIINKELKKRNIEEIIVNSGQHYDFNMSDIFFKTLNIDPPDYDLGVGSGNHGEMTGRIMIELENLVSRILPDLIVVYGDTNTTLAGALVAAKLKIQIAHVEAGIRMQPQNMPEEINRVVVDNISNMLFCPSNHAVKNLESEGIVENVHWVGDVMYDLFLNMKKDFQYELYDSLYLKPQNYILMTMHRDYNVDRPEKLERILKKIIEVNKQIQVVFPIHPRTMRRIKEFGFEQYIEKLIVIPPCDYLNLMGLLKNSHKVLTDSGGLQKEAYFAQKLCAVLMPDSGWVEIIENKCGTLCSEHDLDVVLLGRDKNFKFASGIYGDGHAGKKIVDLLVGH